MVPGQFPLSNFFIFANSFPLGQMPTLNFYNSVPGAKHSFRHRVGTLKKKALNGEIR